MNFYADSSVRRTRQLVGDAAEGLSGAPILVVLVVYLPGRIRFAREGIAGQRFIDAAADLDLFALRALARQPLHRLARISDDPAGAWRRGDPVVVRALADLELRENGMRAKSDRPGVG